MRIKIRLTQKKHPICTTYTYIQSTNLNNRLGNGDWKIRRMYKKNAKRFDTFICFKNGSGDQTPLLGIGERTITESLCTLVLCSCLLSHGRDAGVLVVTAQAIEPFYSNCRWCESKLHSAASTR